MSKIATAVLAAAVAAAARPDVPLSRANAGQVAAAITEALPPPRALESLWPQVGRSVLMIAGGALTTYGIVDAAEWTVISGALLSIGPVLWRVGSTLLARRT